MQTVDEQWLSGHCVLGQQNVISKCLPLPRSIDLFRTKKNCLGKQTNSGLAACRKCLLLYGMMVCVPVRDCATFRPTETQEITRKLESLCIYCEQLCGSCEHYDNLSFKHESSIFQNINISFKLK